MRSWLFQVLKQGRRDEYWNKSSDENNSKLKIDEFYVRIFLFSLSTISWILISDVVHEQAPVILAPISVPVFSL